MKTAITLMCLLFAACGTTSMNGDDTGPMMYPDRDHDGFGDPAGAVPAALAPADYITQAGDCNDNDATIHPEATEVCDGVDNNCDGKIDDDDPAVDLSTGSQFHPDADGDGYGAPSPLRLACTAPAGYVADATDCDDTNPAIHPGAAEVCDGLDNNCNGLTDTADPALDTSTATAYYRDGDGDGYGTGSATLACDQPSGYVARAGDCNDADAATHPGAVEICDGRDNDCDGGIDGTPAQPNQCAGLAGTFSGTYSHDTNESIGSTIINDMSCSGTGSATLSLTRSQALQGTFACHYAGSLGGFDSNQTVTLSASVDLTGHVTGTIDHMYDSLEDQHRVYNVTGTLTSTSMHLSGTGSWYPNAMSAVPWAVTFSFSGTR